MFNEKNVKELVKDEVEKLNDSDLSSDVILQWQKDVLYTFRRLKEIKSYIIEKREEQEDFELYLEQYYSFLNHLKNTQNNMTRLMLSILEEKI